MSRQSSPALPLLVAVSSLLFFGACGETSDLFDFDGDGVRDNLDCDPDNPAVNPMAAEDCSNGIDDDCDGDIDIEDSDCGGTGDDDPVDDDTGTGPGWQT